MLAVVGPTAVGKTALSVALAERLDGEIISMDSRQVYRGMDTGTAKVEAAARARVPHYGLDLITPEERYSAGRFARDAREWIDQIRDRQHTPIIVGGTGFFLKALLEPFFEEPDLDPDLRSSLGDYLDRQPVERLRKWTEVLDPARAEVAISGGRQRMNRGIEVAMLTGRPLSWWHAVGASKRPPVTALTVVLELPRALLDERIERRVDAMIEEGLVDEVRSILAGGVSADAPGMTAVGYREVAHHLAGGSTLDEARDSIARATRQYARRQMTWFRNQIPRGGVLRLDAQRPPETLLEVIEEAWRRATSIQGGHADPPGSEKGSVS